MGKVTGFLDFPSRHPDRADVAERVAHWGEFTGSLPDEEWALQGARCMDCGIPFCHQGCPVNNIVPDCAIIDRAWAEGWVKPDIAQLKTGRTVAIIGSGPAGLACAQQLARVGHNVTVFEKISKAGGLLRYGIPDFKMEKHQIDRRIEQMEAEGVVFRTDCLVGHDIVAQEVVQAFDALVLAGGSEWHEI